jgi:hypothetical protein
VGTIAYQGVWSSTTAYSTNDVVSDANQYTSYVALLPNTNQPLTNTMFWAVLAAQGAQGLAGTNGIDGAPGLQGSQGLTGANGTNGSTGATGPQGAQGSPGADGTNGSTGATGPQGVQGLPASGLTSVTFLSTFDNPTNLAVFYQSPASTVGIAAGQATFAGNFATMPISCTMTGLLVAANNYQTPALDTQLIIVMVNGLNSGMSCSVTTNGNSSTCSDLVDTFPVVAGDAISLFYNQSAIAPYVKTTVQLVCQ